MAAPDIHFLISLLAMLGVLLCAVVMVWMACRALDQRGPNMRRCR